MRTRPAPEAARTRSRPLSAQLGVGSSSPLGPVLLPARHGGAEVETSAAMCHIEQKENQEVIDLPPDQVTALLVDRLGLVIL